ncbi:MAG: helix-turn-helix transcriptional regulator [Halofilum sp. (in: g-proteobacteria)]|nr:helix-turn-helix transcriptional regulator [Halofilum sp. (in: g-proteobacteria)]
MSEHPTPPAGGETGNDTGRLPGNGCSSSIGGSSIRAFARKAGVSDTFLRQCLAGRTEPTRTKLILLADAGGCSVEWLATGQDLRAATAGSEVRKPAPGSIDPGLLRKIIETVEEVLAEHRHVLAPERKALVVAALYDRELDKPRPALAREDILALMSHID